MGTVAENYELLLENVARAAERAGRSPGDVAVMAVTKTFPRAAVDEAYAAGVRLFGENKVQEAASKYAEKPAGARLHLIGHLQRNKARVAASLFDEVESIDKLSTAEALQRHAASDSPIDILIEMNTSGESSKFGVTSRDDLMRCAEAVAGLPELRLRGLMTIAPFTDEAKAVRTSFASLRDMFEYLKSMDEFRDIDTLSMGMSADFEAAVAEGSTEVRIGSALFGRREYA